MGEKKWKQERLVRSGYCSNSGNSKTTSWQLLPHPWIWPSFPSKCFPSHCFFFWKTYSMVISNNIQLSWGKRTHWPRVLCGRGHVAYGCQPLVQKTNHTSLIIAEKRLSEKIKSGIINSDKCVQKNGKALESSKRAKGNHTALQRQRGCTLSNQMCLKCVFLCLTTTL